MQQSTHTVLKYTTTRLKRLSCLTVSQTPREWSSTWTQKIGRAVQRERKARGLSAQELSAACGRLGFPIPRSTITNLENGRKETVSVQEVTVLALALEVPPVLLLYPLSEGADVPPDHERPAFNAVQWFSGLWDEPVTEIVEATGPVPRHGLEAIQRPASVELEASDLSIMREFSAHQITASVAKSRLEGLSEDDRGPVAQYWRDQLRHSVGQIETFGPILRDRGYELPSVDLNPIHPRSRLGR